MRHYGSYLAFGPHTGKRAVVRITRRTTLVRAAFVLGALILSLGVGLRQGLADPILGQRVYYEGGPVELKILQGDAYYTSEVYLFSGNSPF